MKCCEIYHSIAGGKHISQKEKSMVQSGGGQSVFSCEDTAKIAQAAAEAALDAVLNNPNSTAAQKALAETEFIAAVIALRAAEAYCIAERKLLGLLKYLEPVIDTIVMVVGMIILIGTVLYIITQILPVLVLVPIVALA
jgi:hypothetical protein